MVISLGSCHGDVYATYVSQPSYLSVAMVMFMAVCCLCRPQLLEEQQLARNDKKRLRKVLREFEEDFVQHTGRLVCSNKQGWGGGGLYHTVVCCSMYVGPGGIISDL